MFQGSLLHSGGSIMIFCDLNKKGNVLVGTVGSGSDFSHQLCFLGLDYFEKGSPPGYRLATRLSQDFS